MRAFWAALAAALLAIVTISVVDVGASTIQSPEIVDHEIGHGRVEIDFTEVSNAGGYNVYRNGSYLETIFGSPYEDSAEPGVYEYYLTAFDAAKTNHSEASGVLVVDTRIDGAAESAPGASSQTIEAPVITDVVAESGNVELAFSAVTGAGGYNVYRDDAYLTTVSSSPFVEVVAPGEYEYYLTAFDESKSTFSPRSNVVEVNATDDDDSGGPEVGIIGGEDTVTFHSLREVKDSDLPDWVKDDFVDGADLDGVSARELDAPFDTPEIVDLAKVEEVDEARRTQPTPRGLCDKKWYKRSKTITFGRTPGENTMELGKDVDLGNGFSAGVSAEAGIDGSLEFVGVVHYSQKENKCFGIPYKWRFEYADLDFEADVNGSIGTATEFTLEHEARLWEHQIRLLSIQKDFPIAKVIALRIQAWIDVFLALDLSTKYEIRTETVVNEDYTIDGRYAASLRCDSSGCEHRESEESDFRLDLVDRPKTYSQQTLDIVLTPSADLRLGLNVNVGDVLGIWSDRIMSGQIGLLAEMPIRLHWTSGNACSDADGDGINEDVSILLVDVYARLSAYVRATFLRDEVNFWLDRLPLPSSWTKNVALSAEEGRPIWNKHLYMRVLDEGENSPIQPVIGQVGIMQVDGIEREGIRILGPRRCYPFSTVGNSLVYEIDWSSGPGANTFASSGFVPFDWPGDGQGETVRVRLARSSFGRTFNSPWVSVVIGSSQVIIDHLEPPVLDLRVESGQPLLSWGAIDEADGYNIYRDNSYLTTVEGTSWAIPAGDHGSYTVTAFIRETQVFSAESNTVTYQGETRQRAVVSMGDSFISGEGGRWAGNATSPQNGYSGTDRGRDSYLGTSRSNGCHRSDVAEVRSAAIEGLVPVNLACSGAKAEHVIDQEFRGEAPQVDQLADLTDDYDVQMIVLSIGGNDLGFGDILADCLGDYANSRGACRNEQAVFGDIVRPETGVVARVEDAIDAIQRTMADAGQTDYRLVLQSYPSPVPRSAEIRYDSGGIHVLDERTQNGCGLYSTDLDWARDVIVPTLDAEYKRLALAKGIEFLSLRDALQGKEVCAATAERATSTNPGTDSTLEWARSAKILGVVAGDIEEVFHPNALGQRALGRCLNLTWGRSASTIHTCVRGGDSPEDMVVR